jgi:hypothetical protein
MWDDGFSVKQATLGPEGSSAKADPQPGIRVRCSNRVRRKMEESHHFLARMAVTEFQRHFGLTGERISVPQQFSTVIGESTGVAKQKPLIYIDSNGRSES